MTTTPTITETERYPARQTIYGRCDELADELNIRFWQNTDEAGRRVFRFEFEGHVRTLTPGHCFDELTAMVREIEG